MCQLLKFKSRAMTGKVAAVFLVLVLSYAEFAAGSCLSYGHSCWGAHGKRNGEALNNDVGSEAMSDTKWVLSRLLQTPLDIRSWKNDGTMRKHNSLDTSNLIKNEMSNDQDVDPLDVLPSNDDAVYVDEPSSRHRATEDKMRLLKMIKNINRLN